MARLLSMRGHHARENRPYTVVDPDQYEAARKVLETEVLPEFDRSQVWWRGIGSSQSTERA